MTRNYRSEFLEKAKSFRTKYNLTEKDIDILLSQMRLRYTGLESNPRKVLSIEMTEEFPLLFGIDYCAFKKKETIPPEYDDLPEVTKAYIQKRPKESNRVGAKGSKNIASHVITIIKDFPVGHEFLNFDILKNLPVSLSDETSIDWTNGLLKGLVKGLKDYKSYVDKKGDPKLGKVYIMVKTVTPEILEKALKNIEKERLEDTKNTDDNPID